MDKRHWTTGVLGFDEVINNRWVKSRNLCILTIIDLVYSRNVLVSWIGGDAAEAMEDASDEEVKEEMTKLIRKCTGKRMRIQLHRSHHICLGKKKEKMRNKKKETIN